MSRFPSLPACLFGFLVLSGGQNVCAQTPDEDLKRAWLHLQQLATEVRELEECQIVLMIENATAQRNQTWDRVAASYDQKSEALTNEIEDFIAKYATVQGTMAPRRAKESIASFRYRVWSVSLRVGESKHRNRKQLTAVICDAMASSLRPKAKTKTGHFIAVPSSLYRPADFSIVRRRRKNRRGYGQLAGKHWPQMQPLDALLRLADYELAATGLQGVSGTCSPLAIAS